MNAMMMNSNSRASGARSTNNKGRWALGALLALTASPAVLAATPVTLKAGEHLFKVEGNFPSSGFTGARFQVLANGVDDKGNAQYRWSSSQPWVSVSPEGEVSFTGVPTPETKTVSVTATPATGGAPFVHTFTLANWFINDGKNKKSGTDAAAWCQAQGAGYALPAVSAMTTTPGDDKPPVRDVAGPLWNAWGPLVLYANGWQLEPYWSADVQDTSRKAVGLVGGRLYSLPDSAPRHVTCVRAL